MFIFILKEILTFIFFIFKVVERILFLNRKIIINLKNNEKFSIIKIVSSKKIKINLEENSICFKNLDKENHMLYRNLNKFSNLRISYYSKSVCQINIYVVNGVFVYIYKKNYGINKEYRVMFNSLNSKLINLLISLIIGFTNGRFINLLRKISVNNFTNIEIIKQIQSLDLLVLVNSFQSENQLILNYNEIIHYLVHNFELIKKYDQRYQMNFFQLMSLSRNMSEIQIQNSNFQEIYNFLLKNFHLTKLQKLVFKYLLGLTNEIESRFIDFHFLDNCYKLHRLYSNNNSFELDLKMNFLELVIDYFKDLIKLWYLITLPTFSLLFMFVVHYVFWFLNHNFLKKFVVLSISLLIMLSIVYFQFLNNLQYLKFTFKF